MKKLSLSLAAILAVVVLFDRCAEVVEGVEGPEKIRFSFSLPAEDAAAEGFSSSDIPSDAFLQLGLTNTNGEVVLSKQRIQILSVGDRYETELIDLPAGSYNITGFRIVNGASEELYTVSEQIGSSGKDENSFRISVEPNAISTIKLKIIRAWRQLTLKEFVMAGRHYELYYNRSGDVDSIVAHEGTSLRYVYSVVYTAGRIDSVMTVNNGVVESIHDDFVYDDRGRITSYNYYFRLEGTPEDLAFPTTITYDAQGRVTSINNNTFTYDNHRNMVAGFGATYTYDRGLNPFYFVNNLFPIMVEETFIAEHVLSKHNFTSKIDANGNTVRFNNVYDSRKRLISQNDILFYYYQ
jgi:hypothetical protein